MTAGMKTSEFWTTQIINILNIAAIVSGMLPPEVGVPILGLTQGAYNIARGIAKRGG